MCPIMRDTTTAFCGFAGRVAASRQGLPYSDSVLDSQRSLIAEPRTPSVGPVTRNDT
jgi:hypothetical protein